MVNPSNISFSKTIKQAHQYLVTENNPEKASNYLEEVISESQNYDRGLLHWLALTYLEDAKYDRAKETYLKIHEFYQAGYCELLKGDLSEAKSLWADCIKSEARAWARAFESMLEGFIAYEPTFLGLRNHLEVDLGYLLRAKQIKFSENIISLIEDLSQINLECYKFAGRALMNNGFEHQAVNFLLMGQKILPNDPEIYYHLGQYSQSVGALSEAKSMYKHCLLLSPSYTPAKDRLREF